MPSNLIVVTAELHTGRMFRAKNLMISRRLSVIHNWQSAKGLKGVVFVLPDAYRLAHYGDILFELRLQKDRVQTVMIESDLLIPVKWLKVINDD